MKRTKTLIVTDKFIAEKMSWHGRRKWEICKISDLSLVFYAQSEEDALLMLDTLELREGKNDKT